MLNLDLKIKVSFESQNPQKVFQFELHPHTGEIRTEMLVYSVQYSVHCNVHYIIQYSVDYSLVYYLQGAC